jgi:hypothetical protein
MHRGSSKDARNELRPPETLPLSASPPSFEVVLALTRGGSVERRTVRVAVGTPLRAALRAAGLAPEGGAVLRAEVSVPLDTPLVGPAEFTVVPTFSGG